MSDVSLTEADHEFVNRFLTTNEKLDSVIPQIEELIGWAKADSEHSNEAHAEQQAEDDQIRAFYLEEALSLVKRCYR